MASGGFGAASNNAMGGAVTSLQLIDVSGDGKPDLVGLIRASNLVSVRINSGTGTFAAATTYAVGTAPSAMEIVDLNGDGKRDFAVVNSGSNTVSVLRNNGTGTFAAKVDVPTSPSPFKVVAADVNDDNLVDLVIGSNANQIVEFALNQGNGTYATVNFANNTKGRDFIVTDLSGDGKPEIALHIANASVNVYANQGAGVFAPAIVYAAPTYYLESTDGLTAADFDGNGLRDIRLAVPRHIGYGGTAQSSMVLFNKGNGTFRPVVYSGSSAPSGHILSTPLPLPDVNGDGFFDLVRVNGANLSVEYGACLP